MIFNMSVKPIIYIKNIKADFFAKCLSSCFFVRVQVSNIKKVVPVCSFKETKHYNIGLLSRELDISGPQGHKIACCTSYS